MLHRAGGYLQGQYSRDGIHPPQVQAHRAAMKPSVTCSRLSHLPPARQQNTYWLCLGAGTGHFAAHRYRLAGRETEGNLCAHSKPLVPFIHGLTGSRLLGRKWSSPLESSLHRAARLVKLCHFTLLPRMRLACQLCSTHPGHSQRQSCSHQETAKGQNRLQ